MTRTGFATVLAACVAAGTSTLTAQAPAPSSAPATSSPPPLALAVSCTGSGDAAALHVRIENKSSREVAIVLGRTIGASGTQVLDALSVLTIRPATGATEAYPYVNPKHASLTGPATPWIVKIPAGGAHELDAPVTHFISGMTYTLLDPAALAGTRLALDGKRVAGNQVWAGTLEVPIEC